MSTNFAHELGDDVTSLSDFSEESWEEELPSKEQHHSESRIRRKLSRFLETGVHTKKYRLVYNQEADSVRLEPQSAPAEATGIIEDQLTLDEHIAAVIEASKRILNLEDNWDEEGSPGYKKPTWDCATDFIKSIAISYWRTNGSWVTPPRILPGPDGSIDIHWKTPSRELLINVPENREIPAGYYGSGGTQDTIKGKLDISSQNLWVLMWLLR